jgi:hypothetical protein
LGPSCKAIIREKKEKKKKGKDVLNKIIGLCKVLSFFERFCNALSEN